jgi:hypothetical protein
MRVAAYISTANCVGVKQGHCWSSNRSLFKGGKGSKFLLKTTF